MIAMADLTKQHEQAQEIMTYLSTLSGNECDSLDISAFRGCQVAFSAVGAPPGATNDLITSDGFYLRVVNSGGGDLRPHCVSWSVYVSGNVIQVFAKNKIIVLEVSDEDWEIGDTT
jgi:hypothetical protein